MVNEKDKQLIDQFVASFIRLDDLNADKVLDPVAWQLTEGEPDEFGRQRWRPVKCSTDVSQLQALYKTLPSRFPPLYEHLVLSYRWADVDLQYFTLFANPRADNVSPLLARASRDKHMWPPLIRGGFIQFGKGTDIDYDVL